MPKHTAHIMYRESLVQLGLYLMLQYTVLYNTNLQLNIVEINSTGPSGKKQVFTKLSTQPHNTNATGKRKACQYRAYIL